jgi:predicted phosphodiesterase
LVWKAAILGDIHGNYTALKTVFEYIDKEGVDEIYVTGDLVGYYTEPKLCIKDVNRKSNLCIGGNHDKIVVSNDFDEEIELFNFYAQRALIWTRNHLLGNIPAQDDFLLDKVPEWKYLKKLRLKEKGVLPNGNRFLLAHGSPDDPWDYTFVPEEDNWFKKGRWKFLKEKFSSWFEKEKVQLIIIGHTHVPHVIRMKKGYFINPGSVGQPRDGDSRASFITMSLKTGKDILDFNAVEFNVIKLKYKIDEVAKKIKLASLPEYLAKRLYKGR